MSICIPNFFLQCTKDTKPVPIEQPICLTNILTFNEPEQDPN